MVTSRFRRSKAEAADQSSPGQDVSSLQPSAAHRLPFEILVAIFAQVISIPPDLFKDPASDATSSQASSSRGRNRGNTHESASWSLLLLSRSLRAALESQYYSRVSLTSTQSLKHFARTLKERPDLCRKVKALWIAPISVESDFIFALKPPAEGITALPSQSSQPLTDIRQILRSCRSLRHAALDGCLCTLKASTSFGSNCQPLSLVSVNPYSFLGGFSAPMFRKVRRLEMCDTSLASEEVEQVRSMPDLCHFVWTSPREYSDAKRDVLAMLRILTPRVPPSNFQLSIGGVSHFQSSTLQMDDFSSVQEGQPFPVKAQTHRHLRSLTIRTGQSRSAELATSLAAAVEEHSQKLAEHTAQLLSQQRQRETEALSSGQAEDDDDDDDDLAESFTSTLTLDSTRNLPSLQFRGGQLPYIDSAAHTSSISHPSTGVILRTCKFSAAASKCGLNRDVPGALGDDDDEAIIEEWEALRDLICGSGSSVAVEDYRRRYRDRKRRENSGRQHSDQGVRGDEDDDDAQRESDEDEGEIVPGMALRRLWVEWCQRVESGELEVTKGEFEGRAKT